MEKLKTPKRHFEINWPLNQLFSQAKEQISQISVGKVSVDAVKSKEVLVPTQNFIICDTLVYRYLVENRHYKTAKLLKKEREKDYTLEVKEGENISKIFSYIITKYGQSQMELDSVSNCLVHDYLKNHQNQKIQKLAEKLKALVPPIQTKSENPISVAFSRSLWKK